MKNKKIGIIALVGLILLLVSQNIMLMNKTNKLIGTVPSRNIDSNEVEYTSEKTVQGAINDLAEKANIIGTDEEKNKFRDDSKTLIGQIGTDKLNTTSQNLIGAINEINNSKITDDYIVTSTIKKDVTLNSNTATLVSFEDSKEGYIPISYNILYESATNIFGGVESYKNSVSGNFKINCYYQMRTGSGSKTFYVTVVWKKD